MSTLIPRLSLYDQRLFLAMVTRRRRALDPVMGTITHLADPAPAILICLGLWMGASGELQTTGGVALATLVLSHLVVQVLKRAVTRSRPSLPPGIELLIRLPGCFSFPSGHAAAGLSVALPLALVLPGSAGAAVLALGLLVGVSRCYLGVHYPGDVLAGWVVSGATLLGILAWLP